MIMYIYISYKKFWMYWTLKFHTMIPITNRRIQTIKMIKFTTITTLHQSSSKNASFAYNTFIDLTDHFQLI